MTEDDMPRPDDEAAAEGSTPAPAEQGEFLLPGDMLVTLEFHLPGRTVPLAEISAWAEGGVVSLPDATLDHDLPITVRNGDRVIASGRLVRLDDCFGVRIDRTFIRR